MAAEPEPSRPALGDTVIDLRGAGRTFDVEPPVHALRGVDLTVRQGEYVAIVGPSGSGKSTLLNVVGLLDRLTDGEYHLDGLNVNGLNEGQRSAVRARSIGFVFQSFHLLAHRSALENVMFGGLYRGVSRKERAERAYRALVQVGLESRATFTPTHLSGGERQRVAIARALASQPSVLLCDEPTGNLDTANTAAILDLLQGLVDSGLTVLVITHDHTVAERAGRRVRMVDGELSEVA